MKKKRVLFVNDEMVVGGVSKVLNNLLKIIDIDRYNIDLLVLHPHGEMLSDIPDYINVIRGSGFFDIIDISFGNLLREFKFKLIIKKIYMFFLIKSGLIRDRILKERSCLNIRDYDVEVAYKDGFCSLFVGYGDSLIKINWVHIDYLVKNYSYKYMNIIPGVLKRFDYHVGVSKVVSKSYQDIFNLDRVFVIYNIIDDIDIISKSKDVVDFKDDCFSFISVGRLHYQKGYERLVRVCSQLITSGYYFKLYIIGDGELKERIVSLINSYNLNDNIILLGNRSNPFKYIRQADCFVLSSVYEGLPTVVFESMILKVPVVGLRVAGIEEQLNDKYGMVMDNNDNGLYMGLKRVLDDPKILDYYRNNLSDYCYDNNMILNDIYKLFDGEY